jgi:TetR/AcrR family fatty acid metabolism transcriptional regulator
VTTTASIRRDATRTRSLVLDAAERIFARDGWRDTTLAAVGAEAGVSRGTPGYFFGSKSGLYSAMGARLVEAARGVGLPAGGSPSDRAIVLLRRQLELVAARPAFTRLALARWSQPPTLAEDGFGLAALERDLVRDLADLIDGVAGRSGGPDPFGAAAALVVAAWTAGLPGIPGGAASESPARLADRIALMAESVRKLFDDNGSRAQNGRAEDAESGTSLSDSKPRSWRLPGVG